MTINIGAEYDQKVWRALKSAITVLDGVLSDDDFSLAGSQELLEIEVKFGNDIVKIESETYMGVTISGSAEIIEKLKCLIDNEKNDAH